MRRVLLKKFCTFAERFSNHAYVEAITIFCYNPTNIVVPRLKIGIKSAKLLLSKKFIENKYYPTIYSYKSTKDT